MPIKEDIIIQLVCIHCLGILIGLAIAYLFKSNKIKYVVRRSGLFRIQVSDAMRNIESVFVRIENNCLPETEKDISKFEELLEHKVKLAKEKVVCLEGWCPIEAITPEIHIKETNKNDVPNKRRN